MTNLDSIKALHIFLGVLIDARDIAQEHPLLVSKSDTQTLAAIAERVGNKLERLDPKTTAREAFPNTYCPFINELSGRSIV